MKKLYKCMLTMLAMMMLFGTVSVSAEYRPGSRDDDYQAMLNAYNQGWITADEATASIHDSAINGGLSPSVLEDALNRGFCVQYIETYKAKGLIAQDFYPTGTSASPVDEISDAAPNETIQDNNDVLMTDETKVSENSNIKQEQVKTEPTEDEIAAAWEETGRTEPNCTEEGVITYTNSITGESKTESIPATGHDYVETARIEATCTVMGKVTYACTTCDESYEEDLPMTEHEEGDWTTVKEAGAFSAGERILTCSICGEILQSEKIPQNCPLPIYAVIGISCVATAIVVSVIWFVKKEKIKHEK